MTKLIPFTFEAQQMRVIEREQAPWFIAADVADILGYRDAANMVRNLDDDEADTHNVSTSGQQRPMTIISESGLYNAIFRSRRDEAKAFRRWVTGTVLPQIRATGGYNVHSGGLPGYLAGLPDILATRQAVTLPEIAAALSIDGTADNLSLLAHYMRGIGWRKKWVRVNPSTNRELDHD